MTKRSKQLLEKFVQECEHFLYKLRKDPDSAVAFLNIVGQLYEYKQAIIDIPDELKFTQRYVVRFGGDSGNRLKFYSNGMFLRFSLVSNEFPLTITFHNNEPNLRLIPTSQPWFSPQYHHSSPIAFSLFSDDNSIVLSGKASFTPLLIMINYGRLDHNSVRELLFRVRPGSIVRLPFEVLGAYLNSCEYRKVQPTFEEFLDALGEAALRFIFLNTMAVYPAAYLLDSATFFADVIVFMYSHRVKLTSPEAFVELLENEFTYLVKDIREVSLLQE